ncbi:LysR family transcriptional regulator [Tsukamurella sp. NPDC003166]|uniref:LysR family transcriptional regulator n=1 Tax=Tsukamurella sp. NPDC003166 TaxID=3154444 RepID=UPI0033ACD7C6
MTDIDRLRLVATVVRTRSIHETARAHGVAQSTVTRAVAAAERLVGFELFTRSATGSHPRPEAAPAVALIETIVTAFDALASLRGSPPTGLRIACTEPPPPRVETSIAQWRREQAPPISEVTVDDPVAAVIAHEADFAVVPIGTAIPDDLIWQCVRAVRGGGTALVHRRTESPQVTAFLRMIG